MRSSSIVFVIFIIILIIAVNIDLFFESAGLYDDYNYMSYQSNNGNYDSFYDDYNDVSYIQEENNDEKYLNYVNSNYGEDNYSNYSATNTGLYYNSLSSMQKEIYNKIVSGCKNYESEITLKNNSMNDVYVAQSAVSYEHPEFYWLGSFVITTMRDKVVSIEFDVPNDAKSKIEIINGKVSQIVSNSGTSEVEKVKYFYDWIIENTKYGNGLNSQDITSVFIDSSSVCAGYSKAFLYLCQNAGIDCTYVCGFTKNNVSHAWNLVKINQYYYWVDTTWGDPIFADLSDNYTNYNYFLVSDNDFLGNHVIDNVVRLKDGTLIALNVNFPSCVDNSLNYYQVNGCYFKTYDKYLIDSYILSKVNQGITQNIEFKFSNELDYNKFINEYFERDEAYIFDVLRRSRRFYYSEINIHYSMLDSANYVSLDISE